MPLTESDLSYNLYVETQSTSLPSSACKVILIRLNCLIALEIMLKFLTLLLLMWQIGEMIVPLIIEA